MSNFNSQGRILAELENLMYLVHVDAGIFPTYTELEYVGGYKSHLEWVIRTPILHNEEDGDAFTEKVTKYIIKLGIIDYLVNSDFKAVAVLNDIYLEMETKYESFNRCSEKSFSVSRSYIEQEHMTCSCSDSNYLYSEYFVYKVIDLLNSMQQDCEFNRFKDFVPSECLYVKPTSK